MEKGGEVSRHDLEKELSQLKSERDVLKVHVSSKKLVNNSSFGLLGNVYCPFYAPDLLLAVTVSGQLFLLTVIDRISSIPGVKVISANTDGITVVRPKEAEKDIQRILKDTPFEWEEANYREVAYRDVNSYVAVTTEGKVKRKGVFAESGVFANTNPTFQISALAAAKYIEDRTPPEQTIAQCKDIRQFVSVRNVKGGGIQHTHTEMRDNWEQAEERLWVNCQGKKEKRKSRPKPYEVGVGGEPFGRVARWYITTRDTQPITYVSNGNRVPDTEHAALCMTLPDTFPSDIDLQWYVERAYNLLRSAGVEIDCL